MTDQIAAQPAANEAAPAAAPAETKAPEAAPAETKPSDAQPAAAASAPAAVDAGKDEGAELIKRMNDFIKEISSKPKDSDPTRFAGAEKPIDAAKAKENEPENGKSVEDFKSKYEEISRKFAETEPKLAAISQENEELKRFQSGANEIWEELGKDKVFGKAIFAWLESRGSGKAMQFDENLAKAMDAWAEGRKIDWSAVARGISSADSAPASVPSSSSASAPKGPQTLEGSFLGFNGKDIL